MRSQSSHSAAVSSRVGRWARVVLTLGACAMLAGPAVGCGSNSAGNAAGVGGGGNAGVGGGGNAGGGGGGNAGGGGGSTDGGSTVETLAHAVARSARFQKVATATAYYNGMGDYLHVGLRAADGRLLQFGTRRRDPVFVSSWPSDAVTQLVLGTNLSAKQFTDIAANYLGGPQFCGFGTDGIPSCTGIFDPNGTTMGVSPDQCRNADLCATPAAPFSALTLGCGLRRDNHQVLCWTTNIDNGSANPSLSRVYYDNTLPAGTGKGCMLETDPYPATNYDGIRWKAYVTCWQNGSAPERVAFSQMDRGCGVVEGTGEVRCWLEGSDAADPTLWPNNVPTGPFSKVSSLGFACAIRSDSGELACWGPSNVTVPTPPSGAFEDVRVMKSGVCGIRKGGKLECWYVDPSTGTTKVIAPATDLVFKRLADKEFGAITDDGHLVYLCHDEVQAGAFEPVSHICPWIADEDPCYQRDASGNIMCNYISYDGTLRPPPPPVPSNSGATICHANQRYATGFVRCTQITCSAAAAADVPMDDWLPGPCSTEKAQYCCMGTDYVEYMTYESCPADQCQQPGCHCYASFAQFKTACEGNAGTYVAYMGACPGSSGSGGSGGGT